LSKRKLNCQKILENLNGRHSLVDDVYRIVSITSPSLSLCLNISHLFIFFRITTWKWKKHKIGEWKVIRIEVFHVSISFNVSPSPPSVSVSLSHQSDEKLWANKKNIFFLFSDSFKRKIFLLLCTNWKVFLFFQRH